MKTKKQLEKLKADMFVAKVYLRNYRPKFFRFHSKEKICVFDLSGTGDYPLPETGHHYTDFKKCWVCGGIGQRARFEHVGPVLHDDSCVYGELEERYNKFKWVEKNKPVLNRYSKNCRECGKSVIRGNDWDYTNDFSEMYLKIEHHDDCKWKKTIDELLKVNEGFKVDK